MRCQKSYGRASVMPFYPRKNTKSEITRKVTKLKISPLLCVEGPMRRPYPINMKAAGQLLLPLKIVKVMGLGGYISPPMGGGGEGSCPNIVWVLYYPPVTFGPNPRLGTFLKIDPKIEVRSSLALFAYK